MVLGSFGLERNGNTKEKEIGTQKLRKEVGEQSHGTKKKGWQNVNFDSPNPTYLLRQEITTHWFL